MTYTITYTYPRTSRALAPITATNACQAEMFAADLAENGAIHIIVKEN